MMYSKLIQCTKETIQRFKKRNIVNLEHDNNMRNNMRIVRCKNIEYFLKN